MTLCSSDLTVPQFQNEPVNEVLVSGAAIRGPVSPDANDPLARRFINQSNKTTKKKLLKSSAAGEKKVKRRRVETKQENA